MALRLLFVGLLACGCLVLAGCGADTQIRSYAVPTVKHRTFAAIVRHKDSAWFFKLTGPVKNVAEEVDACKAFLKSLRFSDASPQWKLPDGWTELPKPPGRHATLRVGRHTPPLEMTVHQFPVPSTMDWSAFELANVNRWREQLSLFELDDAELKDESTTLPLDNTSALVVEITGELAPKLKAAAMPGMVPGVEPSGSGETEELPFEYAAPKEWTQGESRGALRMLAYSVEQGDLKAEFTVSTSGGGLPANLIRWRDQVKLPETDEATLMKESKPFKVDRFEGLSVQYDGPQETILGVVVDAGGQDWFFKLRGDSALVLRERERFEAFLKSVKWKS